MKTLFALALPLALAACSPGTYDAAPAATPAPAAAPAAPGTTPAPDVAATLGAYHWQLDAATAADGSRIDALSGNPDAPLQLDFADGRVSVSNACNRMGAGFTLEADALTLAPMVSTEMACAEPLMAMEREAHTRLSGSHALTLEAGDPPRLELSNGLGDHLAFVGAPTARTRYGAEPERVFLEVAAERVDCDHPLMPDYRCLQVREIHYDDGGIKQDTGEWGPLYEGIEGFEHRPGVRNVLRLERYRRQDVPADASAVVHVLDMVVESETVAAE
ncbi:META and DUF4377 domain-containing protein [Luteimonas terricola]|uniref:DUF4377 domain-containing protein n=1 Tax=Luteimonas terricola TaxID=645597 RepID=A0ABQ2ELG4_9GAMM|nr:META and DUF4377 domain-containing protein [Luteimonas terricola]GGK16317.1 hypothetical protein GCM10011394_26940 [Luteimonas terricola]